MDKGAWWATVHGVAKSLTRLNDFTFTFTFQFSLVTQSCPTLCNPMNRSTPGLLVHHQLPEFTQTHVHWVSDAIQPSHPLLLLPPVPPSIRVFSNEPALHMRWPNYWSFGFSISRTLEIHIPKKCDSWRQEMYLILSFYYLAPNLEYNKFQLP